MKSVVWLKTRGALVMRFMLTDRSANGRLTHEGWDRHMFIQELAIAQLFWRTLTTALVPQFSLKANLMCCLLGQSASYLTARMWSSTLLRLVISPPSTSSFSPFEPLPPRHSDFLIAVSIIGEKHFKVLVYEDCESAV